MRTVSIEKLIMVLVGLFLTIRLLSLSSYPLLDTTEARYGEIARIMLETGNWLTPQFDYSIPFWGKPPLHTWASAYSAALLGLSEFSLRLPHLIASVFILLSIYVLSKEFNLNKRSAVLITLSTLGFFVASGMVMTDILLTLSVTQSLCCFAIGWFRRANVIFYFGFIFIAIGLLAKGPIALVLISFCIIPWAIYNFGLKGAVLQIWETVPIVTGFALCLIVALPWYLLAENATPGFLEYFIVGEHFLRFIDSGWTGDLYGTAHDEKRGMIWIYWLLVAFPWSFVFLYHLLFKHSRKRLQHDKSFKINSFLVCWMLSPLLLFTMSRNILPIYSLPGIPAFAILCSTVIGKFKLRHFLISALTPALMICYLLFIVDDVADKKSDKSLLSNVSAEHSVYSMSKVSFSTRFYSNGRVKKVTTIEDIEGDFYLITSKGISLPMRCQILDSNKTKDISLCIR